jgi:hypothetical protein
VSLALWLQGLRRRRPDSRRDAITLGVGRRFSLWSEVARSSSSCPTENQENLRRGRNYPTSGGRLKQRESARVLGRIRRRIASFAEIVWYFNGLGEVQIAHRVSLFVHRALLRKIRGRLKNSRKLRTRRSGSTLVVEPKSQGRRILACGGFRARLSSPTCRALELAHGPLHPSVQVHNPKGSLPPPLFQTAGVRSPRLTTR